MENYFCLVLLVLLLVLLSSSNKKTHLTNKKDYPVKTTLIIVKIAETFQFFVLVGILLYMYNQIPMFITPLKE